MCMIGQPVSGRNVVMPALRSAPTSSFFVVVGLHRVYCRIPLGVRPGAGVKCCNLRLIYSQSLVLKAANPRGECTPPRWGCGSPCGLNPGKQPDAG